MYGVVQIFTIPCPCNGIEVGYKGVIQVELSLENDEEPL